MSVADELLGVLNQAASIPGGQTAILRAAQRELSALRKAKKAYKLTHWGEQGTPGAQNLRVADVRTAVTLLGVLHRVEYFTDKGGDGPSLYYHDFEARLPLLAFDAAGLLVVAGGSYRVGERGIVG